MQPFRAGGQMFMGVVAHGDDQVTRADHVIDVRSARPAQTNTVPFRHR